MEQLDYNLLFRWFVGLSMDAPVWDASTFSKNRDRLLAGDVAQRLLTAVSAQPRVRALMSDEHFSVDGTLIQAWASHNPFSPSPTAGATNRPLPVRARPRSAMAMPRRRGAATASACAARSAATRRMRAPRIRTRDLPASRTVRRASWPMRATS